MRVVFNKPYGTSREIENIVDSINRGIISGDGHYTKMCNEYFLKNWIEKFF